MKLLTLTAVLCTLSPLFAANLISSSSCAKTLLTQAFEHIKARKTTEGIALYIQVRDHPNAEIWMIVQASIELKSHQQQNDAIIGFKRILAYKNVSESQLIHVGKILKEMGALNDANAAFEMVLAHPIISKATRNYIEHLLKP